MEISIESNERLNLTVTKTFIDLSSKLSEVSDKIVKVSLLFSLVEKT